MYGQQLVTSPALGTNLNHQWSLPPYLQKRWDSLKSTLYPTQNN